MNRKVKSPARHDNVTPEMAKKAVASVMYKGPRHRSEMMNLYTLMTNTTSEISLKEAALSDIKAYLSKFGLVVCPRSEAHYVFSKDADGMLKQESKQLSPVEADSYARSLKHQKPEKTYFIMVLEP